jgi:hypothetical protein
VPDLSPFDVDIAISQLKEYGSPGSVQENHVGLKLNGTHHLPVYVDDVNQLGDNKNTIIKNTELKYLGTAERNQN